MKLEAARVNGWRRHVKRTALRMRLALCRKRSVLTVSFTAPGALDTFPRMKVLALPPRESCNALAEVRQLTIEIWNYKVQMS